MVILFSRHPAGSQVGLTCFFDAIFLFFTGAASWLTAIKQRVYLADGRSLSCSQENACATGNKSILADEEACKPIARGSVDSLAKHEGRTVIPALEPATYMGQPVQRVELLLLVFRLD